MTALELLALKALGILALVAAALFGVHTYKQRLVHQGFAEAEAKYKPRAERAEAALEQSEKERSRYEQQVKELGVVAHDAGVQLELARNAYGGAVRAGERLRQQLAVALRAARAASESTPPGGGQAADPTADLYADVQRRLGEAEDATLRFADESHIAGLACQRAYEIAP